MTITLRSVPTTDQRRTRDTILEAESPGNILDLGYTSGDGHGRPLSGSPGLSDAEFERKCKEADKLKKDPRYAKRTPVNDHMGHLDPSVASTIRTIESINDANKAFWGR